MCVCEHTVMVVLWHARCGMLCCSRKLVMVVMLFCCCVGEEERSGMCVCALCMAVTSLPHHILAMLMNGCLPAGNYTIKLNVNVM